MEMICERNNLAWPSKPKRYQTRNKICAIQCSSITDLYRINIDRYCRNRGRSNAHKVSGMESMKSKCYRKQGQ